METVMIITLGFRDIQLKTQIEELELRENKNTKLFELSNNRVGGKYLVENFSKNENKIVYPIVQPAINWVIDNYGKVDKLTIVCTDQLNNPDIEDRFKKGDTIEIANLLKLKIEKDYGHKVKNAKLLPITKGVVFYDEMYDFFTEKFNTKILNFSQEDNVILFAQGGIDAINTSLLLKCIETYPNTIQLNKPENSKIAYPLNFPAKFVQNFTKQQILHDLRNYNYSAIVSLNFKNIVCKLAEYAFARVSFDFDKAQTIINNLLTEDASNRAFYTKLSNQLNFDDDNFIERQKEAYLSIKIKLHQKAYADFLVQIFSLAENLLKPKVSEILKGKIEFDENTNYKSWNDLIDKISGLKEFLENQTFNGYKLTYTKPNRATFKAIVDFYYHTEGKKNDFNTIYENLEELTKLRNKVAHELVKVNENDLNLSLQKNNYNINKLIELLDNYFEVKDFGIYDEINKKIISLL